MPDGPFVTFNKMDFWCLLRKTKRGNQLANIVGIVRDMKSFKNYKTNTFACPLLITETACDSFVTNNLLELFASSVLAELAGHPDPFCAGVCRRIRYEFYFSIDRPFWRSPGGRGRNVSVTWHRRRSRCRAFGRRSNTWPPAPSVCVS